MSTLADIEARALALNAEYRAKAKALDAERNALDAERNALYEAERAERDAMWQADIAADDLARDAAAHASPVGAYVEARVNGKVAYAALLPTRSGLVVADTAYLRGDSREPRSHRFERLDVEADGVADVQVGDAGHRGPKTVEGGADGSGVVGAGHAPDATTATSGGAL